MEKSINRLLTFAFLGLIFLAALRIPIGASGLQDPIFYDVLSQRFHFTPGMEVFRSFGLGLSNIKGRLIITEQDPEQENALYDLRLTFDNQDNFGNYIPVRRNYNTNTMQRIEGLSSGKFVGERDFMLLMPKDDSVLGRQGLSIQSFTIDFWLYPYSTGEGDQIVVDFQGKNLAVPMDSRKYGLSIAIEKNTLTYRLNHFFRDQNTNTYSFILTEQEPLIPQKWERHTLVVDASASLLRIYRNGKEQQVIPLSVNQNLYEETLLPTDHIAKSKARFPLIIGKNAMFSLDDFSIYRSVQTNFRGLGSSVRFLETDVFTVSSNSAYLYQMNMAGYFPPRAGVRLAYRFSTNYFFPESQEMPWVYVDTEKNIFPPSRSLGKYFQWRFEYRPIPNSAPMELHSLTLEYRENPSPASLKLTLAAEGDGIVALSWDALPDPNITAYEVYYGTESGVYFGDAQALTAPASPQIVPSQGGGKPVPMGITLENLQNETAYYMIVRVRDRFGKLGPPSEEVFARPSAQKQAPYYSIGR